MRLHGWFLPAVWSLSLCGCTNGPERRREREIQAFTALLGRCAGWSAGWGRAERSASMRRNDPRRPAGCLTVFTDSLNDYGGDLLRRGKNGVVGVVEIVPVSFLKRGWVYSWVYSWGYFGGVVCPPYGQKQRQKWRFLSD